MINLDELDKILPQGAFSTYDMEAMLEPLQSLTSDDIYLEIGVDKGKSLAFARAVSEAQIYGIDIEDKLDKSYKTEEPIYFQQIESTEASKKWKKPISILFIDGDHTEEGVKADWDSWSPHVKKGGVIFFHDADATSPGVEKLVRELKGTFQRDITGDDRCSMAWVIKK